MDESANSLERHIDEERAQLGAAVDALEAKAARAMDWRAHFRDYPGTGMVLAFGVGALAAAAFGGNGDHSDRHRGRLHGAMSGLQVAVLGVLASEARRYVRENFGSDSPTAPARSSYDPRRDEQREEPFTDRRRDRRFDESPDAF